MREAIVFVLIVGGGLAWWFISHRERPARFRRRPIMTATGMEFLARLQRALPECRVYPQVAATSLLEPMGVGKARKAALGCIAGRRVGFAVFDEDMQLLVVIELDHRPRLTRREAECDAYFANAGIRTLRFQTKHAPTEAKIRASVFPRVRGESRVAVAAGASAHGGVIDFEPLAAQWRNTANAHS